MNEHVGLALRGLYRDLLMDRHRCVLYDSGWTSNTIVTGFRVLLAGFVRNDSEDPPVTGTGFMRVGQGDPSWDETGAPQPPESTANLLNPHPDDISGDGLRIQYLDDTDTVQTERSARLQVTATLAEGFPPALPGLSTYPLREFGLFGHRGTDAVMLNSIRHPVIHKDESATLIRIVRLYF